MVRRSFGFAFFVVGIFGWGDSIACSPVRVDTPQQLVDKADAIYRVRASSAAPSLPPDPNRAWHWPETQIRFQVLGVVKGPAVSSVVLPGAFTNKPDSNDHPPPYKMLRLGGRGGSCFASSFRKGHEYLVFLKGNSPYWSPLAPTTEEINGAEDTWLRWVVRRVKRSFAPSPRT